MAKSSDFEPQEGSLFLHRNNKGDNASRPDYRGQLKVNGVVYDVACWVNEDRAGNKYLRGKVREPQNPVSDSADLPI